jgi:hypothetical protein
MGLALFAITDDCTVVPYSLLEGVKSHGGDLALYFSFMTVRITGIALNPLVDGIRRQVVSYIQEHHVSEFKAEDGKPWIMSIKNRQAYARRINGWT